MVQPRSGWITIPHDDHPVGVLVYGRADFQGLTPLAIHFRPFGTGKLNTLEVAIGYANAESPQTGALQIPVHVIPAPARAAPSCSVHTPRVGTRNDWQANTKTQNKIAHHRPRV